MQFSFSDTSLTTFNVRFEIHFVKTGSIGIKNEFENKGNIKYNNENIFISLYNEFQLPVTIKMIDLLGKELYSKTFNQSEITIPKRGIPVIIIIENQQERFTKKIF